MDFHEEAREATRNPSVCLAQSYTALETGEQGRGKDGDGDARLRVTIKVRRITIRLQI